MTDYLHVSNGSGIPVTALVTTDRGVGSTQLIVDSVLNWPQFGIAESGTRNPTTGIISNKSVFYYHLDGSIITIETYAPGYHDIGNVHDQVVILKPTTEWANKVADRLLQPALPSGGTIDQILTKNSPADGDASWKDPSGNSTWVFNQVPTGTIDGVNATFTLPTAASNLILALNGLVLRPGVGNDYTVSGNTITMLTIPPTGSNFLATYTTGVSAMVQGSSSFIWKALGVGLKNGVNLVFTTPGGQAYIGGTLQVYLNGEAQGTSIIETTPSSGTFTFDIAPISTDEIELSYMVAAAVASNADTVDNFNASATFTPNTIPVLDSNGQLPQQKIASKSLQVTRATNQNIVTSGFFTPDTVSVDTSGGALTLSGNSIVIGTGITLVRLSYNVMAESITGIYLYNRPRKNTVELTQNLTPKGAGSFASTSTTMLVPVVAGDLLDVAVDPNGNCTIRGPFSYILVEVVK